ncbi:putative membrane protein YqjE [Janthinobacterium sp. CG_23.3]|uniref:phage holin family protein n=1 Tax=unclassified Janthinobacterium TaxID=2610881 RepID=UPI00047690F5|nr:MULTISPECIES: phage holin family protein [unclassified Janthinobacterium]MEC5160932.1 putative membrane protein YqjE [Janthinobacterium sp. CG_S6]
MAIGHTLGRMAATLVAIVQTRLELAAVEMEEESLRFLGYLALALLAMLCLAIAIVLAAFLVIVLFWDTHRIAAIVGAAGGFAALGLIIGMGVRASFRHKPKLLSFTLAELHKDVASMKSLGEAR